MIVVEFAVKAVFAAKSEYVMNFVFDFVCLFAYALFQRFVFDDDSFFLCPAPDFGNDVEGIADIDKEDSVKYSDKKGISGSGYDPIGKMYHMFMQKKVI